MHDHGEDLEISMTKKEYGRWLEKRRSRRTASDWLIAIFLAILAVIFVESCTASPAHAKMTLTADRQNITIPEHLAIRAILGEARGSGYIGMYAIACAIRNRGHLRGVYGVKTDLSDVDGRLWQIASKAWHMSEDGGDVVHGADHWLSDYDLANCKPALMAWRFKMVETTYIGGHHFYREGK